MKHLFWIICILCIFVNTNAIGCTNFIITKGASADGSVMITYAADSHTRYGYLFFYPSTDNAEGSMLDLFHYETGKYLGQIPDVEHTYSVVGFMNEHQVAIGETTWGGLDSLQRQANALPDYGSLMKIALQRSKTAREAIKVIADLVEKYGYASSGESFSISDKNEAWIMEIIGKGNYEKGAVWVARRIPDGYVSGHANQARITTFTFQKANKWDDPMAETFNSPDVISFAKQHGFYKGDDSRFSFSDVYNPLNFGGARFCDARIWSFFRQINSDIRNNTSYTDYAMGKIRHDKTFPDGNQNPAGFATNRLPLWVKPDNKISVEHVMGFMRDHYEGTPLDMRDGVGAGAWHCPYRWRPMEFKIDSTTYVHERAIATQQTGYSFVAQSRSFYPDPIGGIYWFGVDDADGCVYAPMYCGIKEIPSSYAKGNGSMINWSDSSAFWAFSLVNNWAYTRYDLIHPEIEAYQLNLESQFIVASDRIDRLAAEKFKNNPAEALDLITHFSCYEANQLVKKWMDFFHYLFMKYMDGNVKQSEEQNLLDNGNGQGIPKKPTHPGYGDYWNRIMMQNTGDRYIEPKN